MRASTITWLRTAIPALVPPITPPRWKTCRRAVSASVPLQSEIYCHWSPPRRNIPSQARIAFAVFVSFAEAVEAIDPQPVEGIRATGANVLEEIVYGVVE